MTPATLRTALAALRWSQRGLAEALDCDDRLVRRWAAGDAPVPLLVAAWLDRAAGRMMRDPPPRGWQSGRSTDDHGD